MPLPQQCWVILLNNALHTAQFRPIEPTAFFKSDRLKPEFCHIIFTLNMNVRRLVTITCI
jgi:hypothetical protein